jgi:hypothetical protein
MHTLRAILEDNSKSGPTWLEKQSHQKDKRENFSLSNMQTFATVNGL